jgi:hypothetical protein
MKKIEKKILNYGKVTIVLHKTYLLIIRYMSDLHMKNILVLCSLFFFVIFK